MKKRNRRNFSKKADAMPMTRMTVNVIKDPTRGNRNRCTWSPEAIARVCQEIESGKLGKELKQYRFVGEMEHHLTARERELGIDGKER